jgi:hypothetical protein
MTSRENSIKMGFVIALIMTILTIITFAIAIYTPPVTGPYCQTNCLNYPFTEIISRFPADYTWMHTAMLLILMYVILMVCIYQYAAENKKIFGLLGLSFSIISASILIADYFIQLAVIQPSLIKGETDGIALITQYNPHGIFIALEEVGYLTMSIAFLSLAPVFSGNTRLERAIKWVLRVSFTLILLAFTVISTEYGINREYRFEVYAITIEWTTLIVSGILLAQLFRREMRNNINLRWTIKK